MENNIIFDVPLVTKFWDLDFGTFCALPYNCRIHKIFGDADGIFGFYCTKIKNKYNDSIVIEASNPSLDFDYVITTTKNSHAKLNAPATLDWNQNHHGKDFENYRIFISFFLYKKIGYPEERQKIREHVRRTYASKSESLPKAIQVSSPETSLSVNKTAQMPFYTTSETDTTTVVITEENFVNVQKCVL